MKNKMPLLATWVLAGCSLLGSATFSQPVEAAKENFDRSKPHVAIIVKSSGLDMTGFQQMEGLGLEVEVIEYQDGADPVVRKRPGRVKYGDITLKRGYTGATDIQHWAEDATQGRVLRRDISVEMLDRSAAMVRTFNLLDCFPSGWKLTTNEDGMLVEELSLAVERVEMVE